MALLQGLDAFKAMKTSSLATLVLATLINMAQAAPALPALPALPARSTFYLMPTVEGLFACPKGLANTSLKGIEQVNNYCICLLYTS